MRRVVPGVTVTARDGCLISRCGRVGEDIFVAMPEVEAEGGDQTAVAKVLHTIISPDTFLGCLAREGYVQLLQAVARKGVHRRNPFYFNLGCD